MKSEQKIRVIEFYNTGIDESEPRNIVKVKDREGLHHALDNELFNLDETEVLEIRVYGMTKKEWAEAVKIGKELA